MTKRRNLKKPSPPPPPVSSYTAPAISIPSAPAPVETGGGDVPVKDKIKAISKAISDLGDKAFVVLLPALVEELKTRLDPRARARLGAELSSRPVDMTTYVRERVRSDAAHAVDLARVEAAIPHTGLKGRLRELLVENLLSPWLPAVARCGTGTILSHQAAARTKTQEDVVVYDPSLAPSVLASPRGGEGLFTYNSVLARVEVKSMLNRTELDDSITAARELSELSFTDTASSGSTTWERPISCLFAYGTDLTSGERGEVARLLEALRPFGEQPPLRCLCVVNVGCWFMSAAGWHRSTTSDYMDEVLLFLGLLSNSSYRMHYERYVGQHRVRRELLRPDAVREEQEGPGKRPSYRECESLSLSGGVGPYLFTSNNYGPVA